MIGRISRWTPEISTAGVQITFEIQDYECDRFYFYDKVALYKYILYYIITYYFNIIIIYYIYYMLYYIYYMYVLKTWRSF